MGAVVYPSCECISETNDLLSKITLQFAKSSQNLTEKFCTELF